jgi:hypothetical protein
MLQMFSFKIFVARHIHALYNPTFSARTVFDHIKIRTNKKKNLWKFSRNFACTLQTEFCSLQTESGVHPSSSSMGTKGYFAGAKAAGAPPSSAEV